MTNAYLYLIIFGSFFFLVAAFLPISRVYTQLNPESKLELIKNSPVTWSFSQLLFAISSIVVAIGFLLLVKDFEEGTNQMLGYIGSGLMILGVLAWSIHLFKRATHPDQFVAKKLSKNNFKAYTYFTVVGLICIGISLLNQNLIPAIAWITIIGNALLLIIFIIYKDMPPFVYYILTILIGFMLLS